MGRLLSSARHEDSVNPGVLGRRILPSARPTRCLASKMESPTVETPHTVGSGRVTPTGSIFPQYPTRDRHNSVQILTHKHTTARLARSCAAQSSALSPLTEQIRSAFHWDPFLTLGDQVYPRGQPRSRGVVRGVTPPRNRAGERDPPHPP